MKEKMINQTDKQDEEVYIDLLELLRAYRQKWLVIIIAMLIFGGALGAYCKFLVPSAWQADASIYITNNDSIVSFSDLQISSALRSDYESIIKSRHVLNKVINNLGLDMEYKELAEIVTVTNQSDTHIISIFVTSPEADTAVTIANEVLNLSVSEIYKIIGSSEPSIVDESSAEYVTDVKPSVKKYAAIGALLGLVLVCGIITIRVITDTTLKTEEDIENWLGLPVLANVPMNDERAIGKRQYGYGNNRK